MNVRTSYKETLEKALSAVASYQPTAPMLQDQWCDMVWPAGGQAIWNPDTGVDKNTLVEVGKASITVPEGFVSFFSASKGDSLNYPLA